MSADQPAFEDTGDSGADDLPATSLELRAETAVPPGLALLDTPDIDSVAAGNRELARQLLRAADLWLFVTTANRYADSVPRSEEHTSELQSRGQLVCRLLLEKKKRKSTTKNTER